MEKRENKQNREENLKRNRTNEGERMKLKNDGKINVGQCGIDTKEKERTTQ
jgi:hypothetical protein